jgi:hypothetical protein
VAADFAEQAVQLSDRPSIGRLNALMARAYTERNSWWVPGVVGGNVRNH